MILINSFILILLFNLIIINASYYLPGNHDYDYDDNDNYNYYNN